MDNSTLPAFAAGSHVDLMLAPDLTRSYSLSNDPRERDRYVVSVNKDPGSRGGSRHVHEQLRVGDVLKISSPRNNFQLDETAEHTVLVAGGIGITPLKAMISRLNSIGLSWELFYATKTRATTAFLDELQHLQDLQRGRVHFHFSAESKGARLDLEALVSAAPGSSHFYCCGPPSMIAAFEGSNRGVTEVAGTRRVFRRQGYSRHRRWLQDYAAPLATVDRGASRIARFWIRCWRPTSTLPIPARKACADPARSG